MAPVAPASRWAASRRVGKSRFSQAAAMAANSSSSAAGAESSSSASETVSLRAEQFGVARSAENLVLVIANAALAEHLVAVTALEAQAVELETVGHDLFGGVDFQSALRAQARFASPTLNRIDRHFSSSRLQNFIINFSISKNMSHKGVSILIRPIN